ncbi:YicC/YloC family endoribonuclease [Halioxenophilus sp. WMMB6]|uniref:YicC/YloC family endoribonuclease n=1 Tax=Halioxenophilus sp. WMMB6 TaxID=3073815 RepID=UPI00295ED0EE|nr:YicC/YloC family endoribonuclease [Halioxenophilus sp. WMMB6]
MTRSMTGFARHEGNFAWGSLAFEIRTVNHRYLEPHFRLPENMRPLEPKLRDRLRHQLSRGKVEVNLQLHPLQQESSLTLNTPFLVDLANVADTVAATLANPAPVNPLEVLRWPGIIQERPVDQEQIEIDALGCFDQALTKLIEQRSREGAELQGFIEARLTTVLELVAKVRTLLPVITANQRQKILEKIESLQVDVDQGRLEQELVYFAQKADVDEELDRLTTHVTEVRHCFKQSNPIGRRLDFLMQEFNREANTLSSKSTVSDTTQVAVDLKVLIEQMREQVQNIE